MKRRYALGLIVVFVAFAYVSAEDAKEQQTQNAHYCEMVALWKQTNGEQGWPDYNRSFKTACAKINL